MTSLPRGRCGTCRAIVALRKGGLVREHQDAGTGRKCKGSGATCSKPFDLYLPRTSTRDVHVPVGQKGGLR